MRMAPSSPCSVKKNGEYSAMSASAGAPVRKSPTSGTENSILPRPGPSTECLRYTSRSPSRWGSGFSSTPRTTLKIAVLAPMPSPRVSTTTTANPGLRRSERSAYLRSAATLSSHGSPRWSRTASAAWVRPPDDSSAWRRASAGVMPRRTYSAVSVSRWASSSSLRSSSARRPANSPAMRASSARRCLMSLPVSVRGTPRSDRRSGATPALHAPAAGAQRR